MKAFKVFETQNFERGADPKDSMKLGDVKGRLLEKYRKEAIQAMEEVIDTYGGYGPFFPDNTIDKDANRIKITPEDTGFKIAIYQNTPIQSKWKISDSGVRYYIEYNAEARAFHADTRALFVGWEQEDKDGKWRDRQWTGVIPYTIEGITRKSGNNIETINEAKLILIDYIKSNKPLEGPLNDS